MTVAPLSQPVENEPETRGDARVRPPWFDVLAGLLAATVGLLPWIVTGMRLPLQNLWATATLPDDMPLALLPFNQYYLTHILAMFVTGAGIAGAVARTASPEHRRSATGLVAAGLTVPLAVAAVQSLVVVTGGLEDSSRAGVYVGVVVAAIVLSALAGAATLALIALGPRPAASIGMAAAAVAAGSWVAGFIAMSASVATPSPVLLDVIRWLPPVLVGLALAWCGLGTGRQLVTWLADLVVLWVVPAALSAIAYTAGSRVLFSDLPELLDSGRDVFVQALHPDRGGFASSAALALAIGIVGTVALRRRRRSAAATSNTG